LIAQNIDFLNYRVIDAEDVALQILSHKLAQKRNQTGKPIPSDGKTKSSISADEYDINKKEKFDEAKIANLSLDDQVNYSTVKLSFYENNKIRRELIANQKNLDAYQPNLFSRIGESLVNGWEIVEDIIVFVIQFWAFILLGILFYCAYFKFWRRVKK
jgi:cbb3-type cytochrome oxidase subunit 3